MKYFIIGDVHGCFDELRDLLDKAALSEGDEIISVGDMVNRGPDSVRALDFFRTTSNARAVMGNQELKHVRARQGEPLPSLVVLLTRWQFGDGYADACDYMANLPLYIELPDAIIVHGYYEPGVLLAEQQKRVLVGTMGAELYLQANYERPWYEYYDGDKALIVGHRDYSDFKMQPLIYRERVWGIDTRCVYGGSLTGLLLPEFRLISVPARRDHWAHVRQRYYEE